MRAGACERTRATSSQPISPVDTIASWTTESAVSRPVIPIDAAAHSQSLSSTVWGAWSVATASIVPSASAARSASTSSELRSGGFTLKTGS